MKKYCKGIGVDLNQLSDEELDKLAKKGKSIYSKRYRERKKEAVKRAQQRSYAKIALQADEDAAKAKQDKMPVLTVTKEEVRNKRFQMLLEESVFKKCKKAAARKGISMNEYILRALKQRLEKDEM